MATWGKNRYSALFTEPATHKSSSTTSSSLHDSEPPSFSSESPSESFQIIQRVKYEHQSSIFVASLPNKFTPEELQRKLTQIISQFIDPINVKIIDDRFGNKAAFVQAKSTEDAQSLINRILVLDGHRLRTELARAHRTLVLSFLPTRSPGARLQIVRDKDRHLHVLVNGSAHTDSVIPQHVDDPFSGTGHVIPQFTYTGSSLQKLCELIGPVESFHKLSFEQGSNNEERSEQLAAYHPHFLIPSGNHPESGIWEVKWEFRDDAIDAKDIFSQLQTVRWTWAHGKIRGGIHPDGNVAWHATQNSFNEGRVRTGRQVRMSNRSEAKETLNLWSQSNTSDSSTQMSKGTPPRLDIDEFPPLSNGLVKRNVSHQRSPSDDPDIPITPVSMRHASPEIVLPHEDEHITTNLPVISATVTPTQEIQTPEKEPIRQRPPQYNMTALYITGIPRTTTDLEIRTLLTSYGTVESITRIPSKMPYTAAFVGFGTIAEAAKVMEDANNGVPLMLGGSHLQIRYRRVNNPGFSGRGRGRFQYRRGSSHRQRHSQDYSQREDELNLGEDIPDVKSTPADTLSLEPVIPVIPVENTSLPSSAKQSPSVPAHLPDTEQKLVDTSISTNTSSGRSKRSSTSSSASSQHVNSTPEEVESMGPLPMPTPVNPMTAPTPMAVPQPSSPYYPYYPVPWAPPYPHPMGIPYPYYPPPMYPMQAYGHPYWYPPPPPMIHGAYPPHIGLLPTKNSVPHEEVPQHNNTNILESLPKPPVQPAGSYQNPDGGITYIYPADVIKKYMSDPPKVEVQATNSAEASQSPNQHNNFKAGQQTHGPSSLSAHSLMNMTSLPNGPDNNVNPSIAAAVYANYPSLPPPVEKMPQASFVFNHQGVVQHIEPTGYYRTHGAPGMGLVQAAAAVVANEYQTPTGSSDMPRVVNDGYRAVPSPTRYGPHSVPPSMFPWPQAMYGGPPPQSGAGAMNNVHAVGRGYRNNRGNSGATRPLYGEQRRTGSFSGKPHD